MVQEMLVVPKGLVFPVVKPVPQPLPIITDGLVSWWKFDEGTGLVLHDRWGGSNGVIAATENTFWQYKWPPQGDFDGLNDEVDCGDPADGSLDPGASITIEGWANPSAVDLAESYKILQKNLAYGLGVILSKPEIIIYDGGWQLANRNAGGGTTLSTTAGWYFFGGTFNGLSIDTYVNGVVDRRGSYTGDIDPSATAVFIGSDNGLRFWNGSISTVRVYKRALSPDEHRHNFEVERHLYGV